jgi:hypothetical protein
MAFFRPPRHSLLSKDIPDVDWERPESLVAAFIRRPTAAQSHFGYSYVDLISGFASWESVI